VAVSNELLVLPDLEKLVWTSHPRRGFPANEVTGLSPLYRRENHSYAAFGPFRLSLTLRPSYRNECNREIEPGFDPLVAEYWTNSHWSLAPRYSEKRWPDPPSDLWPSPKKALEALKNALQCRMEEFGFTPLVIARAAFVMGFDAGAKGFSDDMLMIEPNYSRGVRMGALNTEYIFHSTELRSFWQHARRT